MPIDRTSLITDTPRRFRCGPLARAEKLKREVAELRWQRDKLLAACKVLYEKARHVSDDPQWAITEDDLEAVRVAIAAVEAMR